MNSSLMGLFLFAAFMTGSPGPANLLMFAGSSRLGFIRSARFLIGLIIGKTLVNLAIGLGVGAFVSDESLIFTVLKVFYTYVKQSVNNVNSVLILLIREKNCLKWALGAGKSAHDGYAPKYRLHGRNKRARRLHL